MANGRPTKYTPEFGKLICERIAINPVGYSTLVQMYPDMPDVSTIKAWRMSIPDFSRMYLEAKSFQAQLLVEEIDTLLPDQIKYYTDDKGNERIDAPSASMLIAKINNRKWMAARLAPKIFGEQKQVEELKGENDRVKSELAELRAKLDKVNLSEY